MMVLWGGNGAMSVRWLSWWWAAFIVVVTALIAIPVLGVTWTATQRQAADRDAATGGGFAMALPAARHPEARGAGPVGALFYRQHGRLGAHFCTASVVASPAGNLLITAAHCLTGVRLSPGRSPVFAPGYASGRFGGGLWEVTGKFVDRRWEADQDPNDDVAFLSVRRLGRGLPESVQRAAGAERMRFGTRLPAPIRAIGYPDAVEVPVACSTRAIAFRLGPLNQVMFVCPGFTDGTSGGPMLAGFSSMTRTGAVIGVIGGYQRGGDSPSISYSSAFTGRIRSLYAKAVRAGG
jgi:hypothetical protein